MTLTLAWLRTETGYEELVVASDSRLRGGYAWDAAPKLMVLPRSDSFIAFAGATDVAYPLMIQAVNTVSAWSGALSRRQPLDELKGHLLRVFDRMLEELSETVASRHTEALFIFGGYSWKAKRFQVWTLYFDPGIKRFTFRPASPWSGGNEEKMLALVGDEVDEAKTRLERILRDREKLAGGGFDMEPLEVLVDMIRDRGLPTIGGVPQVLKVYQSMNTVPFVVPWVGPSGSPIRTLFGRPLLDYEKPTYPELRRDFLQLDDLDNQNC